MSYKNIKIHMYILLDSGIIEYIFIDKIFPTLNSLCRFTLIISRALQAIDGNLISSRIITKITQLNIFIHNYYQELRFFITKLGYPK
jgi:hypothetical protein